jgi:hypothetical protein
MVAVGERYMHFLHIKAEGLLGFSESIHQHCGSEFLFTAITSWSARRQLDNFIKIIYKWAKFNVS